ncbi:MAG TPA: ATP-binding protein, partial [Gemmatimonadaceae bacterium]
EGSLLGRTAADLGLAGCLESMDATVEMSFGGGSGRFGVRRSTFRESGHRHTLLVITDLSQVLRDEERQAWIRLVRVLSHELNNSLAPIRSIARTLLSLGSRETMPADWNDDVKKGLEVIASRAESLTRFMEAYSKLARLPPPQFRTVDIASLIERVARLEDRIAVRLAAGPALTIEADADQLEQLIINLVRNAADASIESGGSVQISWSADDRAVEIAIADEGHGLASGANLFVPFYTTKPGGTGIGVVLSRQIAEAHRGTLTLENRSDRTGCIARLRLPLRSHRVSYVHEKRP